MDKRKPAADDDSLPQLSEADIVSGLAEAEADEAAGRFVDGVELIAGLRRKADQLQAKIVYPRA